MAPGEGDRPDRGRKRDNDVREFVVRPCAIPAYMRNPPSHFGHWPPPILRRPLNSYALTQLFYANATPHASAAGHILR